MSMFRQDIYLNIYFIFSPLRTQIDGDKYHGAGPLHALNVVTRLSRLPRLLENAWILSDARSIFLSHCPTATGKRGRTSSTSGLP